MNSKMDVHGFDKLLGVLSGIPSKVERKADMAVSKSAQLIRRNVIKEIGEQPAAWPRLSAKYAAQKSMKGGSNLILVSGIRTRKSRTPVTNYRNSFEVEKSGKAQYDVGSNYPQARALEYGFEPRNLPARPHFEPAVEKSRDDILENYSNFLKEVFGG